MEENEDAMDMQSYLEDLISETDYTSEALHKLNKGIEESSICISMNDKCEVDQEMSDGRSLSEKYEMMEDFLKKNNFKIIEKVDIYGNDFEIPFYNTIKIKGKKKERFKNVIEVIRYFNEKGFTVYACGYRKKVSSPYYKRSRLEAWNAEDYYWVKIDSLSPFFAKCERLNDNPENNEGVFLI